MERESTESRTVENWLWKRLWTCRETNEGWDQKGWTLMGRCLEQTFQDESKNCKILVLT